MSESPVPTPAETPAETIRRAAALMRQRAAAATGSPWRVESDGAGTLWVQTTMAPIACTGDEADPLVIADSEHIASWHPAVALTVAAWLEAEVACHEKAVEMLAKNPAPEGYQWNVGFSTLGHALAAALMYLGEVS